MSDDRAWPSDVRELQELFVDVTGEQTFTDAQADAKGRGVVHTTDRGEPARPEDVETDPDVDSRTSVAATRPGAFDDTIDGQPDSIDR